MKNILPWFCVLGATAAAVALFLSNSGKETELTRLREQAKESEALRAQVEELQKQTTAQTAQVATLRKDNEELLRLRNEIRQLRDDKQQLAKQAQTAHAEIQRAQAEAQRAQEQSQATAQAHAAELQRAAGNKTGALTAEGQAQLCINNLRQLDGAKQQWGLEHQKTAESVPLPQEITPYLPGQQIPVCPGGGQYSLGAASRNATCSVPGHALPE